jgi:adenine-specific DNA-methyltransferase
MNKNYMRSSAKHSSAASNRDGFSSHTQNWLSSTSVSERRALGQYMTPEAIRRILLDHVGLRPGMKVLDPSVGTGEFLREAQGRCPELNAVGWDIDPKVLDAARRNVPAAELHERDALAEWVGDDFDLVIGNPPFFQFNASSEIRAKYAQVISGRPNIFALFFMASLSVLKTNGILAFVVPTSMNTGAYFESLRQYITSISSVEAMIPIPEADHFLDAQTSVQIIVLKKGPPNGRFVFRKSQPEANYSRTIFCADPQRLESTFIGAKTVWELGYSVHTGTVVWNQARERLYSSMVPNSTRLLWAHDISETGEISQEPLNLKPSWIMNARPEYGPAILVNRIVGSVGNARVRAATVPEGFRFVGENHVNVIVARPGASQLCSFQQLYDALTDPAIASKVMSITGNTQLSASELCHLLPVNV